MQAEFKFNNGDQVKDRISGLTGIVVTRADHLFGCARYWIAPRELKDGKPVEGVWMDEDGLELVQVAAIEPKRYRVYESDVVGEQPPLRRAGGPSSQPSSQTGPSTR